MSHASGLAAAIRGSSESDTFDLAGQNTTTITSNMTSAFQDPLPISEMIRITLVTGAGKLARQKYDENAAKAVTSALRDLGFEEDRGASCIKECAGSYKMQHDTNKNLKSVVVFPKIRDDPPEETGMADQNSSVGGSTTHFLFPPGSPNELIALSSRPIFENMVKSRCQSWSQKKGCVTAIGEIKTLFEGLEQKLLQGQPLSETEQNFYDQVSASSLEEKQAYVRDLMHKHVDEGLVTDKEKKQLLTQVGERLDIIQKELLDAENKNQSKKIEKLTGMREKVEARQEKLSKISPKAPSPLKHHAEISKLRTEMKPLQDLESNAKGRLLSIKETQALARKEDIEAEILELEEKSRGWFEDDVAFQCRVDASATEWAAKNKNNKKKPTTKSTKSSTSSLRTTSWVTSGNAKPRGTASKGNSVGKKKNVGRGGGVFSAMMLDSDSD